jgi:hypothetical protein
MVSSTAPVQLIDVTEKEEEEEGGRCNKKQKTVYEVLQQKEICQPVKEIVTQKDNVNQIELPDSRLIVWEIKGPTLPGLPVPPKDVGVKEDVTQEDTTTDEDSSDEDVSTVPKQWYIDELHKAMLGINDENNDDVNVHSADGLTNFYDKGDTPMLQTIQFGFSC